MQVLQHFKEIVKIQTTIYNKPSMQVLQHFKEIVKIQHAIYNKLLCKFRFL